MSIAYIPDGLPRIFNDFGAYPNGTFASELKGMMETAGWSLLHETASRCRLRMTNNTNASAGNSLTLIGGTTYYFRTSINNSVAREVLIGADAMESLTNLYNCLTDNGVGKGTKYSSTTTAHPLCSFSAPYLNNTVPMIDVTRNDVGFFPHDAIGGEVVSSTSGTSIALEENFWGGGFIMKSQITPDGLGCSVWVYGKTSDKTKAFIRFLPRDGSFDILNPRSSELSLDTNVSGRRLQIIANPYQLFVYLLNASTFYFCGGVPFLPDQVKPLRIVEATNTIPIKIRTNLPHGWPSGTQVFIDNVKGNLAANGQWTITYVNEMEFTLNGTTGNGEYDTSEYLGAVAIEARSISRCIWYSDTNFIRNSLRANNVHGIYVNNMAWGSSGQPTGALILESFDTSYNQHLAAGLKGMIYEPTIAAGVSASTVSPDNLGIIWDTVMINRPYSLGLVTRFDGNNWRNIMQETNTSMWHVVPL